jgi:hypothetical protein
MRDGAVMGDGAVSIPSLSVVSFSSADAGPTIDRRFARDSGLGFTDPMPGVCAELRAAARRLGYDEPTPMAVVYPLGEPPRTVRTFQLLAMLLNATSAKSSQAPRPTDQARSAAFCWAAGRTEV